MKRGLGISMVCCLVLIGCASSFKSITPISPDIGNPLFPKAVDSLQPAFQWEPSPEPNVMYDFILYEGIGSIYESKRAVGREIYYRQGLTEPRCALEQPLKPNTEYYWSVRVRRGQGVSEWALYDHTYFTGLGVGTIRNHLFIFKTPKGGK